jgi:hypothetical protein
MEREQDWLLRGGTGNMMKVKVGLAGRGGIFGAVAIGLVLAASLASCSDAKPPFVSFSSIPTPPSTMGQQGLFSDAGDNTRCGLPIAQVCACTEMPITGDPANLYFVLDHSGSMARDSLWNNVSLVVLETVRRIGGRANFGVTLFPRSGSDSCDTGNEVMSLRRGDLPPGARGPVWQQLRSATVQVPPAGGTPLSETLKVLAPKVENLKGETQLILATDGAPNCNEGAACTADTCTLNIESLGGCSPGGQNCCAKAPGYCVDDALALRVLEELKSRGVKTYVIGIPGSGPYASTLNALATAGGTARPGAEKYYRVDTAAQADFAKVLAGIVGKAVGTCTIDLAAEPEDVAKLNVYFDGAVLAQVGESGWRIEKRRVTILGESCEKIKAGQVLDVRVISGCDTVSAN